MENRQYISLCFGSQIDTKAFGEESVGDTQMLDMFLFRCGMLAISVFSFCYWFCSYGSNLPDLFIVLIILLVI